MKVWIVQNEMGDYWNGLHGFYSSKLDLASMWFAQANAAKVAEEVHGEAVEAHVGDDGKGLTL
jgi:hypothetical protein